MKNSKAGASVDAGEKKRFEVKKVRLTSSTSLQQSVWIALLTESETVERSRAVGVGHRRRQLRHLPQPHHGPVHRLPGQPSKCHQRGMHRRLGYLQCKASLYQQQTDEADKSSSTPSTSTASRAGLRPVKSARSTTATGSSRSMGVKSGGRHMHRLALRCLHDATWLMSSPETRRVTKTAHGRPCGSCLRGSFYVNHSDG